MQQKFSRGNAPRILRNTRVDITILTSYIIVGGVSYKSHHEMNEARELQLCTQLAILLPLKMQSNADQSFIKIFVGASLSEFIPWATKCLELSLLNQLQTFTLIGWILQYTCTKLDAISSSKPSIIKKFWTFVNLNWWMFEPWKFKPYFNMQLRVAAKAETGSRHWGVKNGLIKSTNGRKLNGMPRGLSLFLLFGYCRKKCPRVVAVGQGTNLHPL